jgi:hypothetical protein
MTGTYEVEIIPLLLGWLLGVSSAIISSVIITRINERKTKRNLACILRMEINLNLYSIRMILDKEPGWKFKTEVFCNFFEHLPFLGRDLAMAVIFFYYTMERKLEEFDEFVSEKNLKEKLEIFHSEKYKVMIDEWVELQTHGHKIRQELDLICGTPLQKKTIESSSKSDG